MVHLFRQDGSALPEAAGLVGQDSAREAAGVVVDLINAKKMAGMTAEHPFEKSPQDIDMFLLLRSSCFVCGATRHGEDGAGDGGTCLFRWCVVSDLSSD